MGRKIDIAKTLEFNKVKQNEIAEYLGVSKGYISQVMSGKAKFSDANLEKLSKHPGWKIIYKEELSGNEINGNGNVIGNHNEVNHCEVISKLTEQNSRLLGIIEEQMEVIKNLSNK